MANKIENSIHLNKKNEFHLLLQCQLVRGIIVSSIKEKAVPLTLKWENH